MPRVFTNQATPTPASGSALTMPAGTLYTWSLLQFQVYPVNVHEIDHHTASDWAQKEIAGAAIYREWVGENDEEIFMRGKLFPYRIGGRDEMEVIETYRRQAISGLLMRGDGRSMGWFVLEKLIRNHLHLGPDGLGQLINFEGVFVRVPIPAPEMEYSVLWGNVLAPN